MKLQNRFQTNLFQAYITETLNWFPAPFGLLTHPLLPTRPRIDQRSCTKKSEIESVIQIKLRLRYDRVPPY